jgi:hypothetical protein
MAALEQGVALNGILECKFLSENVHCTWHKAWADGANPNTTESMVENAHHTIHHLGTG